MRLVREGLKAIFQINDRWRLSEDVELQWILQVYSGGRYQDKAWCGTKAGLLEVVLPHNAIAAPATVLAALNGLPEHYEPDALAQVVEQLALPEAA